jgi:ubiquinone/menaquinone biosynthesis C-methylase UbiE
MEYYDVISGGYDELHRDEQLKKLSLVKKFLKVTLSTRILDVGCGSGVSSDFDCFVAGMDPSLDLLKLNASANKVRARAESIPFRDKSFDIVISLTAIQNFEDIGKGLDEMIRVGKNSFVISTLKKSRKLALVEKELRKRFKISYEAEEEKDIIYFLGIPKDSSPTQLSNSNPKQSNPNHKVYK